MSGYLDWLGGRALIAAHRGAAGGNIPCNSLAGFRAALCQGADVIELDISISLDKTLYVFHPGMEPRFLPDGKPIPQLGDRQLDALRLVNMDGTKTQEQIPRFADCLRMLKGKCLINVDKFWTDIPRIAAAIREEGMQDQVIVKAPLTAEYLAMLEEHAPDMPFMPIVRAEDGAHERLLHNRRIRYIGAEVLFEQETAAVASPAFIEKLHRDGCILWVNPILYDCRAQLSGGHTDDRALQGDGDGGWGWLIARGFDILQTDWPLALRLYGQRRYPQRIAPLPGRLLEGRRGR